MSSLRHAFFEVLDEPKPAIGVYLSLYRETPFYGGPEEGGWWGSDEELVAYKHYPTRELAEDAMGRLDKAFHDKQAQAKHLWGKRCLAETEWLDARGLDDSFLPETAGPETVTVLIEADLGSAARLGDRHYS